MKRTKTVNLNLKKNKPKESLMKQFTLHTLIFSTLLLLITSQVYTKPTIASKQENYAIVIDAGSSHTKLFLYQYPYKSHMGTSLVSKKPMNKIKCEAKIAGKKHFSVAEFQGKLTPHIGKLFDSCLKQAHKLIGSRAEARKTPIFLGATAGMRDLQRDFYNQARQTMQFIRRRLAKSGFEFKDSNALILTGQHEGVYGWIATNYLAGNFEKSPNEIKEYPGALDLGGSSTQISYLVPYTARSGFISKWRLFGMSYNIFSISLPLLRDKSGA